MCIPNWRQELDTELTRTRSDGSSNCMRIIIDISGPSHSIKSLQPFILCISTTQENLIGTAIIHNKKHTSIKLINCIKSKEIKTQMKKLENLV